MWPYTQAFLEFLSPKTREKMRRKFGSRDARTEGRLSRRVALCSQVYALIAH
jgi:hypothetical protein